MGLIDEKNRESKTSWQFVGIVDMLYHHIIYWIAIVVCEKIKNIKGKLYGSEHCN
jgi:hypothetical protein